VYPRCLDPSFLVFILSLYRHPFICILFSSHFTSYNKQTRALEPLKHTTYHIYLYLICSVTCSPVFLPLLLTGVIPQVGKPTSPSLRCSLTHVHRSIGSRNIPHPLGESFVKKLSRKRKICFLMDLGHGTCHKHLRQVFY
jgi:hypothetical protein